MLTALSGRRVPWASLDLHGCPLKASLPPNDCAFPVGVGGSVTMVSILQGEFTEVPQEVAAGALAPLLSLSVSDWTGHSRFPPPETGGSVFKEKVVTKQQI